MWNETVHAHAIENSIYIGFSQLINLYHDNTISHTEYTSKNMVLQTGNRFEKKEHMKRIAAEERRKQEYKKKQTRQFD